MTAACTSRCRINRHRTGRAHLRGGALQAGMSLRLLRSIAGIALVSLFASVGHAEPARSEQGNQPAPPACAAATDPQMTRAAVAATAAFEALWISSNESWLAAYAFGGQLNNPMLPAELEAPAAPPITGYAYVEKPRCVVLSGLQNGKAIVGFEAAVLRFNESGGGWSSALRDVIVAAFSVGHDGTAWAAKPAAHDAVVLPPDTQFRRPDPAELPPHAKWPKRDCRPPRLWDGKRCVRPRLPPPVP
jgi:hypothetical protein